jgi:hypothetical protein
MNFVCFVSLADSLGAFLISGEAMAENLAPCLYILQNRWMDKLELADEHFVKEHNGFKESRTTKPSINIVCVVHHAVHFRAGCLAFGNRQTSTVTSTSPSPIVSFPYLIG